MYDGLKGCMVPTMYPDPDVCEPRESFGPPGYSTTAPHPNSAYHSEHRSVERRYRGRQAQGNRLAIIVETLTTEVIDTTTTAIRHEALIFSFCCPPHCDQPISSLQPRICNPRHRKPDYCEIGTVLQHTTNHHRYSCSNYTFLRLQTVRTAAQNGVH